MIRPYIALIFTSALLVMSTASAKETKSISFCEDPWPPYTYGAHGEVPEKGYAVDFLNEVSKRIDVKFSMTLLPWKRCLLMAKNGSIDGVMLLTKNSKRERYLEFTVPLISDNNLLWFRSDENLAANSWDSFEDLKSYRIGVVAGFNYGEAFIKAKEEYNFNIEVVNDVKSNFNKLALGRIDVFFVNLSAANEVLKEEHELKVKFKFLDKLFEKVPFYIGISKNSQARFLLPDINKAINGMIRDGTIERIMKQFPDRRP